MFRSFRRWCRKRRDYFDSGGSWYVEYLDKRIALLTDPRWQNMFWETWYVEPLSTDAAERELTLTPEFWSEHGVNFVFRNREYGVFGWGFSGSLSFVEDSQRVQLRLLYPVIRPWLWENWIVRRREKKLSALEQSSGSTD